MTINVKKNGQRAATTKTETVLVAASILPKRHIAWVGGQYFRQYGVPVFSKVLTLRQD